jgi:nicotinic acid phosphoribosyltransferase
VNLKDRSWRTDLVLVSAHPTTDDISMEKRILRLEDEFWRIRTDTGELAEAERNALRAYLDDKGFKTAMIDDNLPSRVN